MELSAELVAEIVGTNTDEFILREGVNVCEEVLRVAGVKLGAVFFIMYVYAG